MINAIKMLATRISKSLREENSGEIGSLGTDIVDSPKVNPDHHILDHLVRKVVHHVLSHAKHTLLESSKSPPEREVARQFFDEVLDVVYEHFEPEEPELDATWLVLDEDSRLTERLGSRIDVVVLDCEKMHHDYHTRKNRLDLILEQARLVLIHCMSKGKLLVLKLGSSCPDFLHIFHDGNIKEKSPSLNTSHIKSAPVATLPEGFMLHQGKPLLREPHPDLLIRRKDRVHNNLALKCRASESSFQIILTTELAREELHDALFDHKMGLPAPYHFQVWDRGVTYETILNELSMCPDEELGLMWS